MSDAVDRPPGARLAEPGMDLEKFRAWLAEAYRRVIGVARPEAEPAVPVPEPGPGPETGRVVTRGGRSFVVEAVG